MADIIRYASYLYLYRKSWLGAKPYNNIYYFNFPIMNFPFICSNIPAVPTYGVYISQLIQCSGACASYHDFPNRVLLITRKLLEQRFRVIFDVLRYHHDCIPFHHDLVYRYRISVSQFVLYNYLCNQNISPLTLWVRIPLMTNCTTYYIMW
jgi:hypothetical protein